MNKHLKEIIGYHGTKKKLAKSICQNNFVINKDLDNKLYLGAGIYFFHICEDAIDWNIKNFKSVLNRLPNFKELIKKYTVIESRIQVNENEILDLDERENLYKLEKLVELFEKQLENNLEYKTAKYKTTAIINLLYKNGYMNSKVLSKTFIGKFSPVYLEKFDSYPRKMFCVKDESIIVSNKEKLDINEKVFESIIYFYK